MVGVGCGLNELVSAECLCTVCLHCPPGPLLDGCGMGRGGACPSEDTRRAPSKFSPHSCISISVSVCCSAVHGDALHWAKGCVMSNNGTAVMLGRKRVEEDV